jgi:hypothetical protein
LLKVALNTKYQIKSTNKWWRIYSGLPWRPLISLDVYWYFIYIMATSFSGGRSRNTTDHGQETGKLYNLQLPVECTLFVIYKAGREPMPHWW